MFEMLFAQHQSAICPELMHHHASWHGDKQLSPFPSSCCSREIPHFRPLCLPLKIRNARFEFELLEKLQVGTDEFESSCASSLSPRNLYCLQVGLVSSPFRFSGSYIDCLSFSSLAVLACGAGLLLPLEGILSSHHVFETKACCLSLHHHSSPCLRASTLSAKSSSPSSTSPSF